MTPDFDLTQSHFWRVLVVCAPVDMARLAACLIKILPGALVVKCRMLMATCRHVVARDLASRCENRSCVSLHLPFVLYVSHVFVSFQTTCILARPLISYNTAFTAFCLNRDAYNFRCLTTYSTPYRCAVYFKTNSLFISEWKL